MTIEEFKQLPIGNQFKVLSKPIGSDTPFYIERLKTAIDGNVNAIAMLGDEVTDLYHNLVTNIRANFIKEMEAKGFALKVYGENTYLSRSMETFGLDDDGSLGYSSPRGNSKYNSIRDWYEGKTASYEEYPLRD